MTDEARLRHSPVEDTERYTFGYRRAEMIGAVINLTLLAVIGVYLVYEGVRRLFVPEPITGWLMAVAAIVALVVDVATAVLLWSMSHGSLNVRAAFLHNVIDAMVSLALPPLPAPIGRTGVTVARWLAVARPIVSARLYGRSTRKG